MKKKLIFLAINEFIPELVGFYANKNSLVHLKNVCSNLKTKTFNVRKSDLEPWILWNSIYYSESNKKHGIKKFNSQRLSKGNSFFLELLEKKISVAAISPINLNLPQKIVNRFKYFIPDAWVISGHKGISKFELSTIKAIVQNQSFNFKNYFFFLIIFLRYISFKRNFFIYFRILVKSLYYKELRSLLLEIFFHSFNLKKIENHKIGDNHFIFIFFNCLAHLQHHYLLFSEYVKLSDQISNVGNAYRLDPFNEACNIYNIFIGDYKKLNYDLIICNSLTQQKYLKIECYNKFKVSKIINFFDILQIDLSSYNLYMAREFALKFRNKTDLEAAYSKIKVLRVNEYHLFGNFRVEKNTLILSVMYPVLIEEDDFFVYNSSVIFINEFFEFNAFKSGEHLNSISFYSNFDSLDTLDHESIGKFIINYF